MPTKAEEEIARLSRKADAITDAIERRQALLDKAVFRAEKDLFALIITDLVGRLSIRDGKIENSPYNLALLARIDAVFDTFYREVIRSVLPEFTQGLFSVMAMTGELYVGMDAPEILDAISKDNAAIRAAIGIDDAGNVVHGSALWEVSTAAQVRNDVKQVVLRSIRSAATLRDFTKAVKDYVTGTPQATGRLTTFYRTYAYDLFNQVQEAKNEQFRRGLKLEWFLYVGDVIKDSRDFCRSKAGRIFAVVEADTEWPKDPKLIGKNSGIPYTPRIDRGRWNCRHRIRYITEETAERIDAAKVARIKSKYGS